MHRRHLLLIAGAALAAGCSSNPPSAEEAGAKRREIDSGVDTALADLFSHAKGSRQLATTAKGMLVFPKVINAGFIVGGSYGQGALRKGTTSAGYYSISAGSVGLLAGAQSKSIYVLFMTQDALRKFESSEGWTVGADASVVLLDEGAEARGDTQTAQAPVIGYVRNQSGFMANLSIDGTKFNKLKL